MTRMISRRVLAIVFLLAVTAAPAWAHTQVSVTVTVTPTPSAALNVSPVPPGGDSASPNRFYVFSATDGSSIADTIDVNVCVTALAEIDPALPWNLTVDMGNDGVAGNLPGVDLSSTVTFFKGDTVGTCRTLSIVLSTGALEDLSAGVDYSKNIRIRQATVSGHDHVAVSVAGSDHVKLQVLVAPAPAMTCFATDSSFNLLFLCDGTTAVPSGGQGRFAIVTNKKNVEVATNPGQFYYNLVWTNTSATAKTVAIAFSRQNVRPQGAQAIHAGLFPPPFSGTDLAGFNTVNDSIPSGADDRLENVTVPPGWTLWVTYHLEWQGLGTLAPSTISNSCSTANQVWFVTASMSGEATGTCGAGGMGYLKK